MGDERDPLPPVDPFVSDDPAALERERRRQQREAKRRAREGRKSLGERVSGALDGAADRSREALEQTKERARGREAPPDAPEPPPLRRPRAAPPDLTDSGPPPSAPREPSARSRYSADELMPRRPTRSQPTIPPREVPPSVPPTGEHGVAGEGAPPPPVPPERRQVATGDYPPLPPPTAAPPAGTGAIWIRRLAVLAIVVLIGVAAYAVLAGGDEEAPAPEGPATLKTEDVTIPEGYTRAQIAEVAEQAGLKGDYEKATDRAPKGFDIAKTGAPKDASLEGFLFPATYEVEQGANVEQLVKDQLGAFDDNIDQVDLKQAEKANLTIYDVVTIASMIEREVMVAEERPLVAAVIHNRLSQGIPLGIDATLRYDLDNFDKPLTESDLATESPYNTRLVTGLPPTPIANPGLDSLKAAADPANVDHLYYVVKPGTCGEHYFTDDYDDFLAASDKYNAALEAEGGSPTDC
ncbi:MAG TPA: endolytic transglycosylase MltG [Solirubrobacterales bacterium]|nr:endolytic transglycosylase MltG [Solirubrobacterales bacterium]